MGIGIRIENLRKVYDTPPPSAARGGGFSFTPVRTEKKKVELVALDERPVQLLDSARPGAPMAPGRIARQDYEYIRQGTANVFCIVAPKVGAHLTHATRNRKAPRFAAAMKRIAGAFPKAKFIRPASVRRDRRLQIGGEVVWLVAGPKHSLAGVVTTLMRDIGLPNGLTIGSKSDLWVVPSQGGKPECRTAGIKFGVGGGLQGEFILRNSGELRKFIGGDAYERGLIALAAHRLGRKVRRIGFDENPVEWQFPHQVPQSL